MQRNVLLVLSAGLALLLTVVGCAGPTNSTKLDKPAGLALVAGGKSLTLTWNAVTDAQSYVVYYTTDGNEPTTMSSSAVPTGTTLVHTGLDETKTYKYKVLAKGAKEATSLSEVVAGQPNNVMTFTIGGAGANKSVLVIPYIGATLAVADGFNKGTLVQGTADASGAVTIVLPIDRTRLWGWTVVLDNDSSSTLTTGDSVWGAGSNMLTYYYYENVRTTSAARTYSPWNNHDQSAGHETDADQSGTY